jgi:hypothetical protein
MAHDAEQPLLQDSGREPEAHEAECTGGEVLALGVVWSNVSVLAASNVASVSFHPVSAMRTISAGQHVEGVPCASGQPSLMSCPDPF